MPRLPPSGYHLLQSDRPIAPCRLLLPFYSAPAEVQLLLTCSLAAAVGVTVAPFRSKLEISAAFLRIVELLHLNRLERLPRFNHQFFLYKDQLLVELHRHRHPRPRLRPRPHRPQICHSQIAPLLGLLRIRAPLHRSMRPWKS